MKTLLSFDPLSRVLEAIIEELHITMPDVTEFANKIAQHTGQGIDTIITCLEGIIQSLVGALGKIADDPSNVLNIILTTVSNDVWNLFDAVKGMSLTICDMLVDIFDMLVEFVEGIWEIPGITDAYEDFTGQKFSLLGFATYIAAALDEEPVSPMDHRSACKMFREGETDARHPRTGTTRRPDLQLFCQPRWRRLIRLQV